MIAGELNLEWDEDDFGVPLRSPVRLAKVASEASEGSDMLRARKTRDVE